MQLNETWLGKLASSVGSPADESTKSDSRPLRDSKRFLDEDFAWTKQNDEDAISLISSTSEDTKFQKYVTNQSAKDRTYPLLFLQMFILTNLLPVLFTCFNDPIAPRCLRWKDVDMHPVFTYVYQLGNFISTILTIMTYYSVYRYHKKRFSVPEYKNLTQKSAMNFAIGAVSSILYFGYILVNSAPKTESLLPSESAFVHCYLLFSLAYNFMNLMIMRHVTNEKNYNNNREKYLFGFKNVFFIITAMISTTYFIMGVSLWITNLSYRPPNIDIIINDISLLSTMSIFMNQAYTALYYLDINYIHRLFFLREDYQFFVDKKLRLNML